MIRKKGMIYSMSEEKFNNLLDEIKSQNELLELQNEKLNEQNKELKEIISDLRDKNALLNIKKRKLESYLEFNLETKQKEQALQRVLRFLWRFQQVLILVLLILSIVVRPIVEK